MGPGIGRFLIRGLHVLVYMVRLALFNPRARAVGWFWRISPVGSPVCPFLVSVLSFKGVEGIP